MTRKRSRIEIYVDIQRVIKSGNEKPTRTMYEAREKQGYYGGVSVEIECS